ncbi:MAG: UDP-N-acetylmuramoyl-L-alanyl-D-glutamate--2,6-diaminopimelate ligase [Pseudomonadota bacterium]
MIRLGDLLNGLVAELDVELAGLTIGGLSLDSRQIEPGDVFIALAGQQQHGLAFAEQALAEGAVAVLYDDQADAPNNKNAIQISGLKSQLSKLAQRCWNDPASGLDLIAVTGTNGKSSVAWLLAQALDGGMIGTLGTGRPARFASATHTTPDVLSLYRTLAALKVEGIKTIAIEASSHALDQQRLAGLEFSSAVFTNLGHDHLDYHGNLDHYAAAKARLFRDYDSQRQLICVDDAFGRELAEELNASAGLIRYGLEAEHAPQISAEFVRADLDGLKLNIQLPSGRVECHSRLIGRVNALNLMVVAAELDQRGVSHDAIARIIARLEPVPGRMTQLRGPAGQVVVVDYAHTPDALENALISLRQLTDDRLICVFGCGGERDRAKRPMMGRVAESLADRVYITDDNPRHEDGLVIVREIQAGMAHPARSRVLRDRAAAIHAAIDDAGSNDVVLIAGKGHESEQIVGDEVRAFSDLQTARAACSEAA